MDSVNTEVPDPNSVKDRLRMVSMMEQIAKLPRGDSDQFVRAILMVGSCFLNSKNHGVLLLVENEDTLKVAGINASLEETGHIIGSAADMIISNLEANEAHRKGETH